MSPKQSTGLQPTDNNSTTIVASFIYTVKKNCRLAENETFVDYLFYCFGTC
jgi:hypothetical protein